MRQSYKTVSGKSTVGRHQMAESLAKEGQLLLPMVDLIEQADEFRGTGIVAGFE